MIHKISKSLIRFPRRCFNSIVDWVAGVNSPSGTIRVQNTMSPTEAGSLKIDVAVEETYAEMRRFLDQEFLRLEKLRDEVRRLVDGYTLYFNGGTMSVSDTWLSNKISDVLQQSGLLEIAAGGGSGEGGMTRQQVESLINEATANLATASDLNALDERVESVEGDMDVIWQDAVTDVRFDATTGKLKLTTKEADMEHALNLTYSTTTHELTLHGEDEQGEANTAVVFEAEAIPSGTNV